MSIWLAAKMSLSDTPARAITSGQCHAGMPCLAHFQIASASTGLRVSLLASASRSAPPAARMISRMVFMGKTSTEIFSGLQANFSGLGSRHVAGQP